MAGIEQGVFMYGLILLGLDVSIGRGAEINAGKDGRVSITIGDGCDIASNATLSVLDSHMHTIGLAESYEKQPIVLEDHVFVGDGAKIFGGCHIGHHSVIGANVVLKGVKIQPYSRVHVPAVVIEPGFYAADKRV